MHSSEKHIVFPELKNHLVGQPAAGHCPEQNAEFSDVAVDKLHIDAPRSRSCAPLV